MNRMTRKFVWGLTMFVAACVYFYFACYGEVGSGTPRTLRFWNSLFESGTAQSIEYVFMALSLYGFIKGLAKMHYAVNGYSLEETGGDGYTNVERMLEYRESKMNTMTAEGAGKLLKQTRALDSAVSGAKYGANHKRALGFLDGKLGAMNLENGIDYLKNSDK